MNAIIKIWCDRNNFEYIGENKKFHFIAIKDNITDTIIWIDTKNYKPVIPCPRVPTRSMARINLGKKISNLCNTLQTGLGVFLW